MPANPAWAAGLVAEDCPEGYACYGPPPIFLYVWQGKGLAARCLYVWQGKELFAQKWCKIRGYSDVWQRQDLARGDRQLENVEPPPTAVGFASCDWRSTLISYSSRRYASAIGRLAVNDIR